MNKKRSVKVTFASTTEKDYVMKNLSKLKDIKEFIGIWITNDHTWSERQMIKEYVEKAREKNDIEPPDSKIVWKVRGNIKSGLRVEQCIKTK